MTAILHVGGLPFLYVGTAGGEQVSRLHDSPHLGTRQYARILVHWVDELGLDRADYVLIWPEAVVNDSGTSSPD